MRGRDKLTLVEVSVGRAGGEHQQELSFRMAEPDFRDWTMLCLAVTSFGWVLALLYASVFIGGNPFPWFQNLVFILTPIQFLLRLDRFINSRWSLETVDGIAFQKVKGAVKKSLVIRESEISEGYLCSVAGQIGEQKLRLPDDWVGGQPAKLLAALSLVHQGAKLSSLERESLKQPENPRVIWVEDPVHFESDGFFFILFGVVLTLLGISVVAKSISDWGILAFGVCLTLLGIYVCARNWGPRDAAATMGYRIDGSILSGKADGQPDTKVDLASEKLTIQYWNGLTRHSMRIGWVDQKENFRALTHWQDKVTEDLSRILTVVAVHGNLPEVVKWSVLK